jgi:hypothetical protein
MPVAFAAGIPLGPLGESRTKPGVFMIRQLAIAVMELQQKMKQKTKTYATFFN